MCSAGWPEIGHLSDGCCSGLSLSTVQVHMLGKPDPVIYKTALELMDLDPDQILCVGDSVSHDIRGGRPSCCLVLHHQMLTACACLCRCCGDRARLPVHRRRHRR